MDLVIVHMHLWLKSFLSNRTQQVTYCVKDLLKWGSLEINFRYLNFSNDISLIIRSFTLAILTFIVVVKTLKADLDIFPPG